MLWNDQDGSRCGLTLKEQRGIAEALQCPASVGQHVIGIERVGTYNQATKQTTIFGLSAIFNTFEKFASLMSMGERLMPSNECCRNFKSPDAVWTDQAIAQCCCENTGNRKRVVGLVVSALFLQ